jgi:hypothetical protein
VCYNSTDYEGVNAMEQWKAVVGYEGLYEASNLGNIRSIDRVAISNNGRTRALKGKVLVQVTTPDGYKRTQLNKDGKGKMYFSHRIVLKHLLKTMTTYRRSIILMVIKVITLSLIWNGFLEVITNTMPTEQDCNKLVRNTLEPN